MKNLKKVLLSCCTLVVIALFMIGCDSKEDSNPGGVSTIKVRMTDAPAEYDAVNVEVIDVKIKNNSNLDEGGWVSIGNITPGIYNLLDLTGGVTAALADNQVPSGFLGQIRLILGENNTVIKDGVTYPLRTPSAQQSGLKLQVNQTLLPNITYDFLIDFDVDQSVVVQAGNSGNYNLHPVLRVTSNAVSGSIKGTIPGSVPVLASVVVGGVVVSAYTDAEGVFYLHGIPAGTYAVTLTPDVLSSIPVHVVENVVVENAQTTDVGSISW